MTWAVIILLLSFSFVCWAGERRYDMLLKKYNDLAEENTRLRSSLRQMAVASVQAHQIE